MSFSEMWKKLFGIKSITIEKILENKDKKPKRICFGSTHQNACRRVEIDGNSAVGAINLPFEESIKLFIESETELRLIEKRNGKYWCPANSEEEFEKLENFVEKYQLTVFIRDTLECSIAISEHMIDEENRSDIGELEYQAKYNGCEESVTKIADIVIDFINNSSVYNDGSLICSIPSSKKGEQNLPQKIAEIVSNSTGKVNISDFVEWKNEKPKIKELDLDEKLNALQATDLNINFDVKNKNIILIDDLYQSGLTMQYVAMKLKEAGANKIYGITIVKSRRDTDNV